MRSALHAVRSSLRVLYDPDGFFADRRNLSALRAAGVVALVALVTMSGVGLIGWWFASGIDATRTVTTMEPWPNSTCASFESMNESMNVSSVPEPCTIDEPRTEEVDIGAEIWDAFLGRLPAIFVGTFLLWLLVAVALHLLSAMVDGEGSFGATLAVAGWGMLPSVFGTLFGLVVVYFTFQGIDFANDPEVLRQQLQTLADTGEGPIQVAVSVAVTLWQGYIWGYGLKHARNLGIGQAAIAAGVATGVALLFTLVG